MSYLWIQKDLWILGARIMLRCRFVDPDNRLGFLDSLVPSPTGSLDAILNATPPALSR